MHVHVKNRWVASSTALAWLFARFARARHEASVGVGGGGVSRTLRKGPTSLIASKSHTNSIHP